MRITIVLLGVTFLGVMLLAGCSGSGVQASKVEGATVHALSADHLSAVQLFYGWMGVLYQRIPTEYPVGETEILPDGTLHGWGTLSDGGRYEFWIAEYGGGAGHGIITWGGETTTWQSDATIWGEDGLSATDHCVNTYPNGATTDTVILADFHDPSGAVHQNWDGTARLPGGATMHFTLDRRQNSRDDLRMELPDGTVMTLGIPTRADQSWFSDWPRFGDGATGTFSAPRRGTSQVKIAGQAQPSGEGAWNQWTFTGGNGVEGTFTLDTNSAGTGQWRQGAEVLGALRWTTDGAGTLDLLGGGSEDVNPSAAAHDFRMDRWVRNTACLGPAPVY